MAQQAIRDYGWTGGPQQTSMAVRRKNTCVETRARTLGRDLPNDMRASMPELHSLYTEILPRDEERRTETPLRVPVFAKLDRYSFRIRLSDLSNQNFPCIASLTERRSPSIICGTSGLTALVIARNLIATSVPPDAH